MTTAEELWLCLNWIMVMPQLMKNYTTGIVWTWNRRERERD